MLISFIRLSFISRFFVIFLLGSWSIGFPGHLLAAVELRNLTPIGSLSRYSQTAAAVILHCSDGSEVQITLLAPDLVRVRASFGQPVSATDHSWAIEKTSWEAPAWDLSEDPEELVISTSETEVVVRRSPLLLEFRDAKTHQAVNSDGLPMMFDPKGHGVGVAKKLGFEENFYGLGEKAAPLNKRRKRFTMWTSDKPGYVEGTDPLYQSIPFYIGLQNGAAYGIFFDNSYRTYFDFGDNAYRKYYDFGEEAQKFVTFSADAGELNYYFFQGPSIKKILHRYAELTGFMPLPPMWALGNQQSRYSYYPDSVAEAVVNKYRQDDLPLDALYLDIDYMDHYRVFRWDPKKFPDPLGLTTRLGEKGVKVVTSMDPGVEYRPPTAAQSDQSRTATADGDYQPLQEGLSRNFFLKYSNGNLYVGKVWPDQAVFPDFTMAAVRAWWGSLHRAYTDNGVSGIWNDMNEPTDFVDPDGQKKNDVLSYDEGQQTSQAKNRNVYGMLMDRATYEGLLGLRPNQRPFVLSRSGYAGVQRYAAVWTGDNESTWGALKLSLPMFETLGLSGEPFVGADIGGFIDQGPTPFDSIETFGRLDGELLVRWYQVGFLTPLCRNHKVNWGTDQEPWRFGPYYEDIIRKYLKLRYRLMPFLYTTMEEAHRLGTPAFRPLLLNFQTDRNTLTLEDEFMIGDVLLAAPVLSPHTTSRSVYLPAGTWFDFWTGKAHDGGKAIQAQAPLETVPLFVRGGSVLPMGPEMKYLLERPFDPLTFDVYLDENGQAAGSYYEDDGLSLDYEKGMYRRTFVHAEREGAKVVLRIDPAEGKQSVKERQVVVRIRPLAGVQSVVVDGHVQPRVQKGQPGPGWNDEAGGVVVQLNDQGQRHNLEIY